MLSQQIQPSFGQPPLPPRHTGQGTDPAVYGVGHVVRSALLEKPTSLCFQKINPNPNSGRVKLRTKTCSFRAKTLCASHYRLPVSSSLHLAEYENRSHSDRKPQGQSWEWFYVARGSELLYKNKHETSEQTSYQPPNISNINSLKRAAH